jgi:hypothetical protein
MDTLYTWFLNKVFKNSFSGFTHFVAWFSSERSALSDDTQSAPLLHQALIPQSGFDKLCAYWAKQPFGIKISALASVTLFFGIIGLFTGFPALLSLSALIGFIGIHGLLVSHNTQRIEHAKRIIKETMAADLSEHVVDEVQQQVQNLVNEELGETQKTSELIEGYATEIHQASNELVLQNKEVVELVVQTKEQALGFNTTLKQTEQKAAHFSTSVETFTAVVDDLQEEQKVYTQAVHTLTDFIETLTQSQDKISDEVSDSLDNPVTEKESHPKPLIDESLATLPLRVASYQKDIRLFDEVLAEKKERLDMEQAELEGIKLRIHSRAKPSLLISHPLLKKQEEDLEKQTHIMDECEKQIQINAEELQSFDVVLSQLNTAPNPINANDGDKQNNEALIPDEKKYKKTVHQEQIHRGLHDRNVLNDVQQEKPIEPSELDEAWLSKIEAQANDCSYQNRAQEIVQQGISCRLEIEQKRLDESNKEALDIGLFNERLAAVKARRMARAKVDEEATKILMLSARQRFGFDFNVPGASNEGASAEEEKKFSMQ